MSSMTFVLLYTNFYHKSIENIYSKEYCKYERRVANRLLFKYLL
nr:MAG TPA: hypothetical protein [Caudoviricetes sp.]DAO89508.1 MAG TPA: hypothetical protein [Caudoviricetes sp.]DAQ21657.1 MAG TPA: hypothetical protein [Caudoviricetes sp.]